MELHSRIGVSTDSLFGVSLDKAIIQVRDAGFDTFELIPADFQTAGGFPCNELNPGIWPRDCTSQDVEHLKDKLSCFSQVTIHAPHLGTMFGSGNPGVLEEADKQYLEFMEFGVKIGAKTITFHHAGIEASVAFAKKALPYAHEHGLYLGYENGLEVSSIEQILNEINDNRFGILIDVGHLANGKLNASDVFEKFSGKIVEIHASGVYRGNEYQSTDGWGMDHFPFEMNDSVDYPAILKKLKDIGFEGPIILELCYARTNDDIIKYCKSAKQYLVGMEKL